MNKRTGIVAAALIVMGLGLYAVLAQSAIPAVLVTCSFDLDGDKDVDQAHFALLQTCIADCSHDPRCGHADLQRDGKLDDFEKIWFKLCEKGPGIAVDPICQTFAIDATLLRLSGEPDVGREMRYSGTGPFTGVDFKAEADANGKCRVRVPAGSTGVITHQTEFDTCEQWSVANRLNAMRKDGKLATSQPVTVPY